MKIMRTKYYPVNVKRRVIVNRPFARERDCFLACLQYNKKSAGFCEVKGKRLLQYRCYQDFEIVQDSPLGA